MYIHEKLRDGIVDPGAAHYEEEFEFPFFAMVKKYAEEHDVSYSDAAAACVHDYSKTLKIRDQEFTDKWIAFGEEDGFAETQVYKGRVGETQKYEMNLDTGDKKDE